MPASAHDRTELAIDVWYFISFVCVVVAFRRHKSKLLDLLVLRSIERVCATTLCEFVCVTVFTS